MCKWVKLQGETPRTLTSLQVYRGIGAVLVGLTVNKITRKKMLIWEIFTSRLFCFAESYSFQICLSKCFECFMHVFDLVFLVAFAY